MPSFRRSRKGVSTIVAELLMVLIVIIMSATAFIWAVPVFQSTTSGDNSNLAFQEHFQTITGSFASFVASIPETVQSSPGPFTPYQTCSASSPVTSPTSANIFVPVNGVCSITASVGNVYVSPGGNLTVVGATINGDLYGDTSLAVNLSNVHVVGWTHMSNVQNVVIVGSFLNTSGNMSHCTDACGSAMYEGGRGLFTMVNTIVTGQVESEVSHYATVTGNTISGRLEVESADFGQIANNYIGGVLDLDQNGVIVISGNTVSSNLLYGTNGWCSTGFNTISGSTSGSCVGNLSVDILNTGDIPVKLVTIYVSNAPLAGGLSWGLLSGKQVQCGNVLASTCTILPIIIPVGEMARITMGWTPPSTTYPLPWNYIYFTFVSRYLNFVDGYLYFTYGLGVQVPSRLENRVCPPCI